MIQRTYKDIPDGEVNDADQYAFLESLGLAPGYTWDDLLHSKRVLIISEAGAGKTYECRQQSIRLKEAGEPAFFVELAALATDDFRNLLDPDEEARLENWYASQSEVATFFLDSIDELKLTKGSFERALKKLNKSIGGQLHRARVVITTRPIPTDEQLVRNILPVPQAPSPESEEETFAKIAMREHRKPHNKNKTQFPDWRTVALMPLSKEQISDFCRHQGVSDPHLLLEDLQRRNALEFARRPQDLIELCADWREHKRIRTHREQVATNVRVKLLPREDRPEPAELSVDKAIEGASRLALAVQMTRRMTIRHNAAADTVVEEAALDPSIILSDWLPNERKALLERPLFGFASYGRVRFHHRSVAEYLAAERLIALRNTGMPFRALKRLLFAETKGKTIVRPSKRPVAGWIALQEDGIFELLRDNEPAVLLDEGDPESLTQTQRNQVLRAYVERYGPGGWRGLQVPHIQVNRFASSELAPEIDRIWRNGVENPDVRAVLISLVEAGRIEACADIVFDVTQDLSATANERLMATEALVAINDERLVNISARIADADDLWPERVVSTAILSLIPKYMSVEQFCRTLRWIKQTKWSVGNLTWQLPRLIAESSLELTVLEDLRDGLIELVSEGLKWRNEWPHITSDRQHLSGALAATCECGLDINQDDRWLYGCVIALRLYHHDYCEDEPFKSLRERLFDLKAEDNERLFWIKDAFLKSLHEIQDPSDRFAEITFYEGAVQLRADRDLTWVSRELGDTTRDVSERAVLFEAAIRLSPDRESYNTHVEGLRPLVVDEPSLEQRLNDCLKPSKYDKERPLWEKKEAERKKQEEQKKAENYASWVQLWREVANQPESAFSTEKSGDTAYNLWRVMCNEGEDSRTTGWNRRFIEELFNKETADKLRRVLMKTWRVDHPTFPSERPDGERNSSLFRWHLGLAAIYAEAEDFDWAAKLSDDEAELAARYVPMERSGFPQWIEQLVSSHPNAVDRTLGNEISWDLTRPPGEYGYSNLLQGVDYAPKTVGRVFLPRLISWLDACGDLITDVAHERGLASKVRLVTWIILKHGDVGEIKRLQDLALNRLEQQLPFALCLVWMSTLMRIEPEKGVDKLAAQIETVEPSERSDAVTWLASLFGDRQDGIDLGDARFTPQILLRLLRLAYRHVRVQDDAHLEESDSSDTRDDAEQARYSIVNALLNAKGEEGLAAKLEMAADPLCAHFKDRILALADENWAQEIDAEVFDEAQAVALDRRGEAPASTNEAMFAIMKDRLSDLDELLLSDVSPREAWAGFSAERVMRREITRALRDAANSLYTVGQEEVTADEKETDIRLRSVLSNHEGVIELKLGDGRTATDLRDTIENQLVRKYMAAEYCKAGALLVTLAKDRLWKHPDENRMIKAEELLSMLTAEADRVQKAVGGGSYIYVHLLDLRPRLPIEAKAKA